MVAEIRLKINARRKEREEKARSHENEKAGRKREVDRPPKHLPRTTTFPPAKRSQHPDLPVIRVRRLDLAEEMEHESSIHPPEAAKTVTTQQENERMWACIKAAATLDTEADQLEKVATLRRIAATFRGLAKKWRVPQPTDDQ